MTFIKNSKPLGLPHSLLIYLVTALLMYGMTKFVIPYLTESSHQEMIFWWFVIAGLGVFIPIIVMGLLILKAEGRPISRGLLTKRLRFRKLTRSDVVWSMIGLISAGTMSFAIMELLVFIIGPFETSPEFMTFQPLNEGRYWLLFVWLPYWVLNILGEEFFWRGVLLPRQELAFGKNTWLFHAIGWWLFHAAFGWKLMLTLLPLILIQSYIVQRRKNTWIGVIMHAGLNGPSFLAICFGLI